jgi:Trypsin-co-occurring domain 1
MADYIETKTKSGATIRIEVESGRLGTGFGHQVSSRAGSGAAGTSAYDQTLETIRACANDVVDTLQNLEAPPSAASIDFAIKIDGEAGALIAKSGADAQFKVSLSWKQVEPDQDKKEKD